MVGCLALLLRRLIISDNRVRSSTGTACCLLRSCQSPVEARLSYGGNNYLLSGYKEYVETQSSNFKDRLGLGKGPKIKGRGIQLS